MEDRIIAEFQKWELLVYVHLDCLEEAGCGFMESTILKGKITEMKKLLMDFPKFQ